MFFFVSKLGLLVTQDICDVIVPTVTHLCRWFYWHSWNECWGSHWTCVTHFHRGYINPVLVNHLCTGSLFSTWSVCMYKFVGTREPLNSQLLNYAYRQQRLKRSFSRLLAYFWRVILNYYFTLGSRLSVVHMHAVTPQCLSCVALAYANGACLC